MLSCPLRTPRCARSRGRMAPSHQVSPRLSASVRVTRQRLTRNASRLFRLPVRRRLPSRHLSDRQRDGGILLRSWQCGKLFRRRPWERATSLTSISDTAAVVRPALSTPSALTQRQARAATVDGKALGRSCGRRRRLADELFFHKASEDTGFRPSDSLAPRAPQVVSSVPRTA